MLEMYFRSSRAVGGDLKHPKAHTCYEGGGGVFMPADDYTPDRLCVCNLSLFSHGLRGAGERNRSLLPFSYY